jgi:acyl-[acyl-carrier-protein]-phospholipid O-acyltransferase/long-chain-fatty-acid--[acyl-carrier-protein] ligase
MFLYPSPLHYRVIPDLAYDCNATVLLGTDTFFNGYARYGHPYDFSSVRLAVAGAEKLKESTRHLYADKFCVNIMQGYGVTEASPVISFNTLMEHKHGSVGRAFPGIECRLEAVSGMERGGKLLIKGDNVMLGYIKADNPGVIQPQGEWYDTGDIVEIDENGFITILGRAKRFAKIAGEMVSLSICEELALQLEPDVIHAAIAASDDKKGEHIILYSECPTLARENLLAAAREKGLPEISLPKHIVHIEQVPRLGSGKIDYPALAKLVV